MNKITFALLLFTFFYVAHSVSGIDVATLITASTFQCFKTSGITFVIVRAYRSTGVLDTNAVTTLTNAKAQGLITDIYMFPCRGKNATTQVN